MNAGKKLRGVTLGIDFFPHGVFGAQPGSEWNGHYKERCYHPLGVMLGETGHWLGLELRPGNVHTADGDADMLLSLIDRVEAEIASVADVRGARYVIRLPANNLIAKIAEPHARTPARRRSRAPG